MKKFTLLTIVSSAALLSACATSPKAPEPQQSHKEKVYPMLETATHAAELPSATVKLSAKDGRLVAKIYTDWHDAKQGDLKLHWIAPEHSHCINTTFPIMKYKAAGDYTWAYRTLEHQGATCLGAWKAEVIYTPTKAAIAEAQLDVSAENATEVKKSAPAQVGNTVPAASAPATNPAASK